MQNQCLDKTDNVSIPFPKKPAITTVGKKGEQHCDCIMLRKLGPAMCLEAEGGGEKISDGQELGNSGILTKLTPV